MFIEKAIKIADKWRYLVLTCTLPWLSTLHVLTALSHLTHITV